MKPDTAFSSMFGMAGALVVMAVGFTALVVGEYLLELRPFAVMALVVGSMMPVWGAATLYYARRIVFHEATQASRTKETVEDLTALLLD
ncbi:MAG: hypothetical protein AAF752_02890 [Bacteroidota bacterium]